MAATRCPVCHGILGEDLLQGLCARCLSEMLFDPPRDSVETSIIASDGLETRSLVSIPGFTATAEIARGGMGIVYKAIQHQPGREVALKMLLPHQLGSSEMRQRFQLEARTIATLDHPGILPVYQVGESDGIPFFTMKLAAGGTLSERLTGFCGQWNRIADLMIALADAVHFAHQRGVLHRDLKPGNVLFDEAGQPYVSDFGLAKVLEDETDVTATFDLIGTPRYLPPEIIHGGVSSATVAGDVYGLCTILYELLAQRPIFEGANPRELMRKITDEDPTAPSQSVSGVPVDLETICLRGLAKEAGQRFDSAAELAADLRRWRVGEPIESRPISRLERLQMWVRRHQREAAMAGVIAGLLLALLIGSAVATFKMAASREELRHQRDRAQEGLVNSILAQSRDSRLAGQLGHTANTLPALFSALSQAKGALVSEIREEFTANLTLHDFIPTRRVIRRLDFAEVKAVDCQMRLCAEVEPNGFVSFRHLDGSGVEWRWHRGVTNTVDAIAFDPTGNYAAVTYQTSDDVLLDLRQHRLLRVSKGDWGGFSPVGDVYLTANPKGNYHLSDIKTGDFVEHWRGNGAGWTGFHLDFNAHDSRFCVALRDRFEIWDGRSSRPALTVQLPNRVISFNWRSEVLAAGGEKGEVYLWNLKHGERREIRAHQGDVESVLLSPDGELLFSTARSGPTLLWHVPTLDRLGVAPGWRPIQFDRSGEELAVVTASDIQVLRRIRPSGSRLIQFHGDGITAIRGADFKPDGSRVAVVLQDGVRVVNAETGQQEAFLGQLGAHAAFWSATGDRLTAIGRRDVRQYDVEKSNGVPRWKFVGGEVFSDATWLNRAAISANRQIIGVSGVPRRAGFLNMESFSRVIWESPVQPLEMIHLSETGDAAWIGYPEFHRMDLVRRPGTVLQTLPIEMGSVSKFAPVGPLVAIASRRNLKLVTSPNGAVLHEIAIEELPQSNPPLAWSGDGKILAVTARPESIDFYSTENWQRFASVPTPVFQSVTWMDFAPDGRTLGVGYGEGLFYLWNLTDLKESAAVRGVTIPVPIGTAGPVVQFNWNPFFRVSPPVSQLRYADSGALPEFDPARVPARSAVCTPRQVDLTRFYNRHLDADATEWNPGVVGAPTVHEIHGYRFDLRGAVQISARNFPKTLDTNLPPAADLPEISGPNPAAVRGIPIQQRARRLVFLGASDFGYSASAEPVVAHIVVFLSNGTLYRVPVRLGKEIADQWVDPTQDKAEAVAFFSMSRVIEANNRYLGLRFFDWVNPHPEVPVDHIDWVGTHSLYRQDYAPFLVGVTVDPADP